MKFLVDANVLSEVTKPSPSQQVLDWILENEAKLAVNPIILGELEYGILLLPSGRQRRLLEEWFSSRITGLRVLEFNSVTAGCWARLLAKLRHNATPMPVKDSLIAATAIQHDLIVCTRNVVDFKKSGVDVVNPFE